MMLTLFRAGIKSILTACLFGVCQIALGGAHTTSGMPEISATETEDLGSGLYTFRWGPYRNIFLVTDEGVIASDPMNAEAATLYREAIRAVTDQPVKYVVYSHSHWDHVSGGAIFKEEGATFISQENCALNLRWSPNPGVVTPDVTFVSSYSLTLGGRTIELHHFGPIHDNCMSVMLVRPANLIFVVDIVSPPTGRYMPFDPIPDPDMHLGNAVPYLQSVEDLAERNGIETIIGGHLVLAPDDKGNMVVRPSTGPILAVTERRLYYEQLLAVVKAKLDTGAPILSVHEQIDLEPFRDLRGFDEAKMRLYLQRAAYFYILGR
jgi:glyoxylase-like metal-dependent hydrolase (beta-lactamase superfamily II)